MYNKSKKCKIFTKKKQKKQKTSSIFFLVNKYIYSIMPKIDILESNYTIYRILYISSHKVRPLHFGLKKKKAYMQNKEST